MVDTARKESQAMHAAVHLVNGQAAAARRAETRVLQRVGLDGKFFVRGGQRVRLRGVTYGPFIPDAQGHCFSTRAAAAEDFTRMVDMGFNALRVYHVPPDWLLDLAEEANLLLLVDVPWSKHICFLDSAQAKREARQAVDAAVADGNGRDCILAYSICNELPPDVVRWHGAHKVERFLRELADVIKQADPGGLVTFANYPPTEYLDLSFVDFATFNVYLHEPEAFRRYLFRLQNLVGDMPLVLGELGMDTLRHGEIAQADFLAGHLRQANLLGLAGAFVFSWTDEWHTGSHTVQDWAFGVTHADRVPKAACAQLREMHESPLCELLPAAPKVSVVVCTYNGARTLEQCLHSLLRLDYPDFEVIVVDDGSEDDTASILDRFPEIRVIRQPNHGLSAARNAGLQAAAGTVIAYTDSDCFADRDWLSQLVAQLEASGAAAVGGPNLPPDDGRMAACVAASPGQPMHVLESDQVAEHIPGCNMAFRREALESINGFDTQYRKAGDDVDVCWRLQQAGHWITFAPAAFVWHHRRQGPRTYLRQQAGYGEAEALLRFKHPDRYNGRGHGKWRGVLYGGSLQGLILGGELIYRGTFGSGLFQCVYQPAPAHWAMIPSTLEWQITGLAVLALGLIAWPVGVFAVGMLALSLLVAALQARQAKLAPRHEGFKSRLIIAGLCYMQPLVRSWWRYRIRYFSYATGARPRLPRLCSGHPKLGCNQLAVYWGQAAPERTQLLHEAIDYLSELRCGKSIDTGWSDADIEVFCDPWTVVRVCTAQEEHGGGRRLIRIRYKLRLSDLAKVIALSGAVAVAFTACFSGLAATGIGVVLATLLGSAWYCGARLCAEVFEVFDRVALRSGLVRCGKVSGSDRARDAASTSADSL